MAIDTRRIRFTALDGWRAVAALIIALHRLDAHGYHAVLPVIKNSYLFVDFFFVLSGFVITHAYWDKLRDAASFVNFAIRRFGRLWPLHVSMLAAFVAIEFLQYKSMAQAGTPATAFDSDGMAAIGAHAILIQALGFTPEFAARWNVPSWSISVEFWTYLVFGLLCLIARQRFLAVSSMLVAGSLAVIGAFSPTNMDTAFDYGLARCLAGFFMGHLCYRIWSEQGAYVRRAVEKIGPTYSELFVVLLVIAFVSLAGTTPLSILAPFFFAPLILVFSLELGSLSRFMQRPYAVMLGALSYSIYMVAFLVVRVLVQIAKVAEGKLDTTLTRQGLSGGNKVLSLDFGSPIANDLFAVLFLGIIILVSKLTYAAIEVPGQRFFNHLADGYSRRTRVTAPAPNS